MRECLSMESFGNFEAILVHIGYKITVHLNQTILKLGTYLFPVNVFSKKNRVMIHGMRKPHSLKFRRYTARMIKLNKYLDIFRVTTQKIIGEMELNDILLDSMTNGWGNQAFLHGFYFEVVP